MARLLYELTESFRIAFAQIEPALRDFRRKLFPQKNAEPAVLLQRDEL